MVDINSNIASCLCGSVKITAQEINPNFSVCHCDTCRTWGGGPYFSLQCGADVKIEGDENVTVYDSSKWASRGFCSICGTHLFYRLKKSGEYTMPVGIFSKLENLRMEIQYFKDKRPDYYCFSNETKELTAAEVLAYFSSQTE